MAELSAEMRQALEKAMQLAVQRHQMGDIATAEALYGKVLTEDVRHAVALHNLGLILFARGDNAAALDLLNAAVREKPREPVFQFNLGLTRQTAGDAEGAIAAYWQALQYKSDYRECWENLGVVLQERERFVEAEAAYRSALRIDRCSPVARKNLGNVLRVLGRLDDAEIQYREALDCNPLNADIALQYSTALLSRGDFDNGWRWYEWRYWAEVVERDRPYHVSLPKWNGTAGGSVLLYGEQGIGDEIMFASCIPAVVARVERTVLHCEPRLAALFARSFPGVVVEAKARGLLPPVLNPGDSCAERCSLASLPQFLRNAETDFPGTPYLIADATATARWRERLAAFGARLNVGLSWRGGSGAHAREARSLALERLTPLFEHADIRFINIQYGDHREEIARNATASQPLLNFDDIDPLRDMDDFAALLSALDLVITIDNSTAHLAGALGVATWLLLPSHADWRWMQNREDTPWYRSLRLFWQSAPGHAAWAQVVARVRDELIGVQPRHATGAHIIAVNALSPIRTTTAPDVVLLNDTAYWYHWGCTGTSLALHENLHALGLAVDSVPIADINALAPLPTTAAELDDDALYQEFCARNSVLISRLQAVASVVINGEGSIHDLGQTARALLYLAHIAKCRLGKNTQIINHSAYPAANGAPTDAAEDFYRKVYAVLDFVAVREENSAAALARLGIETVEAFDCLPLFIARHAPSARANRERRVVIAGSVQLSMELVNLLVQITDRVLQQGYTVEILVGANAFLAYDDVQLLGALHQQLRGRYTLIAATSEAEWLDTIAGASLLVSGRFHHSIAAACLGTPFLVTASNTLKIDGLLKRLDLSAEQVWISPSDIAQAHARVDAMLQNPQNGRIDENTLAKLRELAAHNFDGLRSR